MGPTKERKDQLIEHLTKVISEDVLNEMDYLMILQICTDACQRKQIEMFEDILTECILAEDENEEDPE